VSSGNYHAGNALAYTDLALCTCDEHIAADVREVFDFLGGRTSAPACRRLLVAPFTMRRRLCELLEREIEWSRRGEPGHVVLKVNSLSDRDVIRQLYRASHAGVRVDLVVRGVCRLRPGVAGLSDRIHVRSIVGRFLEHSRAWYFRNGGNDDLYIGSADLRTRNLDRRLEVLVPITDASLARRIRHNVLGAYLADTASARSLHSDGTYARVRPRPGELALSSQRALMDTPVGAVQP
jgi:polyphosphate kinase